MPFPEVPRVIYEINPLDKVICQIRFPPILKIENELPAAFQDAIRNEFPLFSVKEENMPKISSNELGENGLSVVLGNIIGNETFKNYEFISEDSLLKVNLTRNFIALTSYNYKRWENFKEFLIKVFKSFSQIYSPPFATRIGLRYVDIFVRSNLAVEDKKWDELLQPFVVGMLDSPVKTSVISGESINEILLSDGVGRVRISSSLSTLINSKEQCFVIDSDFYNQQRCKIPEIESKLEFFHHRATRLIQWMIKNELNLAMRPQNADIQ